MTLDYSGSLVLTVGNIPETAIAEVFSIQEILSFVGFVFFMISALLFFRGRL